MLKSSIMWWSMGKRSDFERKPRDFYPTPKSAVEPLLPHINKNCSFIEPCAGDGSLVNILHNLGHRCVWAGDIEPQALLMTKADALTQYWSDGDYIITNPPWTREILHPMIDHFRIQKPTWLLIDADWAHTRQSAPYMKYCNRMISVGRVKWIPDSDHTGKENVCWYEFLSYPVYTTFYGRTE